MVFSGIAWVKVKGRGGTRVRAYLHNNVAPPPGLSLMPKNMATHAPVAEHDGAVVDGVIDRAVIVGVVLAGDRLLQPVGPLGAKELVALFVFFWGGGGCVGCCACVCQHRAFTHTYI